MGQLNSSRLKVENLAKTYANGVFSIENISFELFQHEIISILGTSGSGKSTILKIIGGHENIHNGKVFLLGEDITNLPPNKRKINTIFQDLALFPHMNVKENIMFPLRMMKLTKDAIETRVKEVIKEVKLEGYEFRSINSLSGGEQQRVAIARAIISEPQVLLCDEPLSKLDKPIKKELINFLLNFFNKRNISTIYVTHDYNEALLLSDRIMVINEGKIIQFAKPEEILNNPVNSFVANLFDTYNVISVKNIEHLLKNENHNYKYVGLKPNKFSQSITEDDLVFTGVVLNRILKDATLSLRVIINDNDIIYIKLPLQQMNISKGDNLTLYYSYKDLVFFEE